ncbi:MAG: hypothetical protein NT154_16430, partial [Verrucomicrobia bacterium]|nr:hypothetical protein [Verrucomicrobiota bacterium]
MKPTRAIFPLRAGVWIGLSILLLSPSLPLKADTYAGYGPESPGRYPSTNALARPYYVEYRS